MKKIFFMLLALIILTTPCVNADSDVNIEINGQRIIFADTKPFVENGRTFVPIRTISEMLEYDVLWDEETETVTVKKDDYEMNLTIGNSTYTVNGEEKQMDVAPFIKADKTVVPIRFIAESFGCDVDWEDESQTVVINKYKNVTVSTANEFLESINDYTVISLNEGEYNLTNVDAVDNKKVEKAEVFDGYEYLINSVNNLVIKPVENSNVTIVVEPRYANVLPFMNCNNITIQDITAGHTIEKGHCAGGVIRFYNCKNSDIENCKLYGCGTYGVISWDNTDITVSNTEIYDCTYGAIEFFRCKDVEFNNCIFRDCREFSIIGINDCDNVEFTDCVIKDNINEGKWSSFISASGRNIVFTNCKFENNEYNDFCNNDNVIFENCDIQ